MITTKKKNKRKYSWIPKDDINRSGKCFPPIFYTSSSLAYTVLDHNALLKIHNQNCVAICERLSYFYMRSEFRSASLKK